MSECDCTKPVRLRWLKIDEQAIIPHKAHKGDAGMDLHVLVNANNQPQFPNGELKILDNNSVLIFPHQTLIFHTGLKCATEEGYAMHIFVRSSTGIKKGLALANGTAVIDTATYRGELLLAFRNVTKESIIIKHLDKLAQCEIYKILDVESEEVEFLEDTERGDGGIGSSGS